jgi:2TM domain-containing protein
METTQSKDGKLWKMAKKRAEFKRHLLIYVIVNVFLWGVWLVTSIINTHFGFIWPVWVSLGWGIGLAFNYFRAYTGFADSMTEKEYQKLVNNQNG